MIKVILVGRGWLLRVLLCEASLSLFFSQFMQRCRIPAVCKRNRNNAKASVYGGKLIHVKKLGKVRIEITNRPIFTSAAYFDA